MLFSLGLTCQHVSQAVDVHHVKRAVAQSVWSICAECLKERRMSDGEPVAPSDIWLCLKCGSQVSIRCQFMEVDQHWFSKGSLSVWSVITFGETQ